MTLPNRRRFLRIAGAGFALGLAGCSSDGSNDGQATDDADDGAATETRTTDPDDQGTDGGTEDDGDGGNESDGDGHGGHGDVPEGPSRTAAVAMTSEDDGTHFDPDVVWIEVGGTVEWTLESGSHTSTAYHPDVDRPLRIPEGAEPWDSGILSDEGETFSYTFETEGVYDYYCMPHEEMGMIGSVIVGDPDPDPAGQPGLAPPGDDLSSTVSGKIEDLNGRVESALGGEE